jgi:CheY-like chemotaxis protein
MSDRHDILVVDDRSLEAQETLIALEQVAPAATVLHVDGGAEALEYLFSAGTFAGRAPEMPHLILLSLEMRLMSGLSLLEVIRAHPVTRAVPVVMLSIEPDVRRYRRHDLFDANAYVTKPCDFGRYCAVLKGCVRHWLPAEHRKQHKASRTRPDRLRHSQHSSWHGP